ncbi:hypothetical protein J1N35_025366, partial [Gossypium stocksii]
VPILILIFVSLLELLGRSLMKNKNSIRIYLVNTLVETSVALITRCEGNDNGEVEEEVDTANPNDTNVNS